VEAMLGEKKAAGTANTLRSTRHDGHLQRERTLSPVNWPRTSPHSLRTLPVVSMAEGLTNDYNLCPTIYSLGWRSKDVCSDDMYNYTRNVQVPPAGDMALSNVQDKRIGPTWPARLVERAASSLAFRV
jgi:hypothetical protein